MLFYDSPSVDPYFNLALEDHLFSTLAPGEKCLLLWRNENTIVVGKNQNTAQEVNQAYIDAHHITVARRLSGGGAVYHDLGNLNFTLITDRVDFERFNFRLFVEPVIKTLASFGVTAEFTGRNDLVIDGKKFCGNAQYTRDKKLLHHGCIMLSTDLSSVSQALQVQAEKFQSKGVKSVSSRVTTINAHAPAPITMEQFKKALQEAILAGGDMDAYQPTQEDLDQIQRLRDEKYATWDWIYGNFATYDLQNKQKFPWGLVHVYLQAKGGRIEHVHFRGDFFGTCDIGILEQALEGLPLNETMKPTLEQLPLGDYLMGCTAEDLYRLLVY